MNYNIYVLTFIIGTILGSFYHVVGYRMPLQLNWMNSRSFCQHCHTSLTGFDLVPVVSYIFLRGRCRHCQQSIPYVFSLVWKLLFKKESLVGGDIKLYGLVGLVLGIRCTFISLLLSTILALIYCCIFRRGNNRTPLTFGPFIAASAYFCLFHWETFLEVYIKLFY